jgi:glucose/mannose-6-phosphate isomerase
MAKTSEKAKSFPADYLHYDTKDAYHVITALPDHIKEGYLLAAGVKPAKPFTKIVIAGMGGSGIAGDLLKSFLETQETAVTVEVVKEYNAPKGVDEKTLLIAVSYSGNTEETLSCYKGCLRKNCQAISVSSGGKLEELSKTHKHPHLKLPMGLQPRMAVAYLFFPLLRIMENARIIPSQEGSIQELREILRKQDLSKQALELSTKLQDKVPLILSGSIFAPVAYRWKTQFNENAKTPSFCHILPEFNHNEILSFTNRTAQFHAIFLGSEKDHRRVVKRIELTKDILQKKGVAVTEISFKGEPLRQIFTAIHLGDLTSYFLALRYETDPTPVALIEQFKKDMGPFIG